MNILVDQLAGDHRADPSEPIPHFNTLLPGEKWQVWANDTKFFKSLKHYLYEHMSFGSVTPYWIRKERFSEDGANEVNWGALGQAMCQASPAQRQWITKRAARDCGSNAVLFKRKSKDTDKCPRCRQPESVLHVLTCKDETAETASCSCLGRKENKTSLLRKYETSTLRNKCSPIRRLDSTPISNFRSES
jgi:hypothetical protein